MTDLIHFEYASYPFRATTVDGEPWFLAKDVCAALGTDTSNLSKVLDEDEKGTCTVRTPGGVQYLSTVSEAGLYSLILRSRKPDAKQFKRWVTHEVLPALRKNGTYSVAEVSRKQLAQMVIEAEDRAELAEAKAAELEPAANSWTQLADAAGDYSLREAAQILDRDPAISTGQNRLSKYLRQISWTDRTGQPYQAQVDTGRLVVRTRDFFNSGVGEQQVTTQLRITVKGLQKLHELLGGSGPLLLAA